jgi:sugar phosphate isomerase/epimerase
MACAPKRDIYLSLFMITANLFPDDPAYTAVLAGHMKAFLGMGYDGFDMPIAAIPTIDHAAEVASYVRLRERLDKAGLPAFKVSTNVGATPAFDPTVGGPYQRNAALAYLRSRVDITKALGGTMLAGPIVFPYGQFPVTDAGIPLWSDALQDWLPAGYSHAVPVFTELAEYAEKQGIKLAIEPVDHWETAAPNIVADVLAFLDRVPNPQLGVCVDSAHVVLGRDGPAAYRADVARAAGQGRLHYIHISAPDRGAIEASWIPWKEFLEPVLPCFEGPYLIEVFNAIPAFLGGLRLTRRKFWIPGEDPTGMGPSAYDVASAGLATVRQEMDRISNCKEPMP